MYQNPSPGNGYPFAQRNISFPEAVKKCFANYANFHGRASRMEYWWFILFLIIVGAVLGLLTGGGSTTMEIISGIINIGLVIPTFAVTARRLHDVGKSGALCLLLLIPVIGFLILLFWTLAQSEPYNNRFGEVPDTISHS